VKCPYEALKIDTKLSHMLTFVKYLIKMPKVVDFVLNVNPTPQSHIYIYIYIYICVCVYIYIYRERERSTPSQFSNYRCANANDDLTMHIVTGAVTGYGDSVVNCHDIGGSLKKPPLMLSLTGLGN
jgi:hypothetical protein